MTDEELLQKLEDLTKNAQHHHLETLRSILLHNGIVHYLQSFKKGSLLHLDPSTFARVVPLSTYEDYVDYINQMAEGKDDPFLSVDPLRCFFYRYSLNPSSLSIFDRSFPWKSHTIMIYPLIVCFALVKPSSYFKKKKYYQKILIINLLIFVYKVIGALRLSFFFKLPTIQILNYGYRLWHYWNLRFLFIS